MSQADTTGVLRQGVLSKESATHNRKIFSKFGIPKKFMSNMESEYIGKDYKLFAKQWDFKLDLSRDI